MSVRTFRRLGLALFALALGHGLATRAPAQAQDPAPTSEPEAVQDLSDLDKLTEKLAKDKKNRPPFEFFRSQVAPFDVLPFAKPNHWSTLAIELRSNDSNFEGLLQTTSEVGGRPQVPLLDMPHAMIYGRDAFLAKEQSLNRSLQMLLPKIPKTLYVELTQPGAIRPNAGWEASLQKLETHQMCVVVLCPDPSLYNSWSTMLATLPASGDPDRTTRDRQRYYRMVLPQVPDRPNLSAHPLTWTTISHLVWDGFDPQDLSIGPLSQQQAMLDWLHFGGQILIVASGPKQLALQESFLGPYLPADSSGAVSPLLETDLAGLSEAYLPPQGVVSDLLLGNVPVSQPKRYGPVEKLSPTVDRPLMLTGLRPREGVEVVVHPLSPTDPRPLAVERRVGRGRVLMLGVNPNDPALAAWRGLDTLVRRLLLRRPEEVWGTSGNRPAYQPLSGPELTWTRFLTRDLGATPVTSDTDPNQPTIPGDLVFSNAPVSAWLDNGTIPSTTRDTLEKASGITIPGAPFVLRVILAYLIALVPLNWLLCRYVLRRKELAWVLVPFLSFGFAYAVERAAAYDLGFNSACDEIDVLELQGASGRAHLSRFASLYSTGRVDYRIAYPQDPTALALPMRSYQALRGEQAQFASFQSSPVPALADFRVQPRSLAMFRSEAIVDLGGGIELVGDPVGGKVVNGSDLELHDAVLIDVEGARYWPLGRIAPWPRTPEAQAGAGHSIALGAPQPLPDPAIEATWPAVGTTPEAPSWADLDGYLRLLRDYRWSAPEERGELRLVAWVREVHPGQSIEPAVDRHRGFRLVVAHLRYGLPDPSEASYSQRPEAPAVDPEESAP